MGVMLQAFYWDCPEVDNRDHGWWPFIQQHVPELASAGFTSLWLPPPHKAYGIRSMGYDPYDYYDLGDLDQKGGVATWYGTRDQLSSLIQSAHEHNLTVLVDMVLNHNSGADAQEHNPLLGQARWTKFTPKSGRFPRDVTCFHPTRFEQWDVGSFGEMPDLCHRNPYVYAETMNLGRWLIEEVGFDGFRFDLVKGYGSWIIAALQEYRYSRNGVDLRPFGVGEHWSGAREIFDWLHEVNNFNDNPISAFDFPLRDALKKLCDEYGFSLRNLPTWDSVVLRDPFHAVTFVENHDTRDGDKPILRDKLLAYSYILTHEGHPCVFWKDYFNWNLASKGTPHGIEALVKVHERYAGGETQILWVDDDLYIMARRGQGAQPGLVCVLNNRGDGWNGARVTTPWSNQSFAPVAWWSAHDLSRPQDQWAAFDGRAELWAPPRGYAVYALGNG